MAVFPDEPGSAGSPLVLPLHLFQKRPLRISGTGLLYRPDVLPATQPSVSKHWRKHNTLTLTSGQDSSFLHPQPDSWWSGVSPFTPALRQTTTDRHCYMLSTCYLLCQVVLKLLELSESILNVLLQQRPLWGGRTCAVGLLTAWYSSWHGLTALRRRRQTHAYTMHACDRQHTRWCNK